MAGFCYYCGRVGHSERVCSKKRCDAAAGVLTEGQFGDWLKADFLRTGAKQVRDSPLVQKPSQPPSIPPSTVVASHSRPSLVSVVGPPTQSARTYPVPDPSLPTPPSSEFAVPVVPQTSTTVVSHPPALPLALTKLPVTSILPLSPCGIPPATSSILMTLEPLVNIPIDQLPLRKSNRTGAASVPKPQTRKWKRMKGKENIATSSDTLSPQNQGSMPQKRSWSLRDEDDDPEVPTDIKKQHCELNDLQETEMSEVVVASLDWPQIHL